MRAPKVLVLTGVGINSNRELAEAFALAGGEPEQVHVSIISRHPEKVLDYQLVAFPGGFSYGDHVSSGKLLASLLKSRLGGIFPELRRRGVPMIGICNGFQILVKLGLLPGRPDGALRQEASLIHNDSGRYEDRWVELAVSPQASASSPWLKGIERLECPVRHGEGKLVLPTAADLERLKASGQVVLRYAKNGTPTTEFPHNPNGSWDAIAGLVDPTGLVLGLMPHPEVAVNRLQLPDWTRRPTGGGDGTDCLKLFKNIIQAIIRAP